MTTKELAAYIDYSVLKPEFTEEQIIELTKDGVELGCATICINPGYMELCEPYVKGTETMLCPVTDFPFGTSSTASKVQQIEEVAKYDTVKEVDVVANFGHIRAGKYEEVTADIKACADAAHKFGRELKVIFETDAFNCIIEFLAVRDIKQMSAEALKKTCGAPAADVIIALGSDLPVVAETACELYKAGYGEKLMFCGGIGHSTINLKRKVAKILDVKPDQLPESEAEIYACLAKDKYQIESSSIFMDKTSTNTSENIKNAIQIFKNHTIKHQNMILIQDPILQKRSYVTALDLFNHSQKK